MLTALCAFYSALQEPCNANSTPHIQLHNGRKEVGTLLEHAAVRENTVAFPCFWTEIIYNSLCAVKLHCSNRASAWQNKPFSKRTHKIPVIICSTFTTTDFAPSQGQSFLSCLLYIFKDCYYRSSAGSFVQLARQNGSFT